MGKRKYWTPEEEAEIWRQGIKVFPDAKPGEKYGYSDKFKPAAINNYAVREKYRDLPVFSRTHDHRLEILLLWGGTGSGKSSHAVALGLEYTFGFPGSQGLVGGNVYKDLYQNVITMYRDRLTIREPWDHPSVRKHPSEDGHNKILTIEPYPGAPYSSIEFFQFKDWIRVRGRNRDWIHFEEISQLADVSIIDELPRRCRSLLMPTSHIICTTNPPESTSHWIYPKWNISQHMKSYEGEKTPIGKPCTCHLCQDCLNNKKGEFKFDKNGFCTNKDCVTKTRKAKRDSKGNIIQLGPPTELEYYYMKHKGQNIKCFCPGGQYFWRVLFSSAVDNPHVRADYMQSQSNSDSKINQLYVQGEPMDLNSNSAFASFSNLNIREEEKEVDYDKDIMWGFDFNNRPQCSAICQETYKEDGELDYIDQLDEIILFDIKEVYNRINEYGERERGASPEHIAATFMKRYPNFKKNIYMYGDPSAVNKTSGPLEVTKFQIIYNILSKAGYNVEMMVKKTKEKRQIPIPDRVNNANWLFKDYEGRIRFYINKKCEYTITSLKDLKIGPDGLNFLKKNIDEYARRTTEVIFPEDVYKYVRLISHPADAVTYYLYQKFPLISGTKTLMFLNVPGESTTIFEDGKIISERSEVRSQKYQEESIVDIIRQDNANDQMQTLADYLRSNVEEDLLAASFMEYYS